jgi:hypothetical protein
MHIEIDGQLIPPSCPAELTVVGCAVQVVPPFVVVTTPDPPPAIAQKLLVGQLT